MPVGVRSSGAGLGGGMTQGLLSLHCLGTARSGTVSRRGGFLSQKTHLGNGGLQGRGELQEWVHFLGQ